jgi:hypothetical protein
MRYRHLSLPEPNMVKCTSCHEEYPQHFAEHKNVCSACEFVIDVLAQSKTSCGTVVVESYMLWIVADAAGRFEKRGWAIELGVPSVMDVLGGKLTVKVKAKDVACCSGKADAVPRCYATACGQIPTPDAVRDVKQAACRTSCPVAAFAPDLTKIDALTRRCCTALSQITVDPIKVKIERQDVPALIGAVTKLRARGWRVSITDTFEKRSLGNIQILPQSAETSATAADEA